MKKLLLFPYHPDIELLAEKSDMLQGVSIAGVHSFREDLAAVAAVNETLGCTGNFTEMLAQCDTVLLLDDYRNSEMKKYYDVMQEALGAGKQVMITPGMAHKLDLSGYRGQYAVLSHMPEESSANTGTQVGSEQKKHIIESPVAAVFGMGKNCCKFENQILLKSVLDREGYASVWVSSNPLGALFGAYTMPDFLFDGHLALEEKVIRFNRFLYGLSVSHAPDLFVIGVPEGISEFSVHEYNHFAEYPLVIGSAVSVDSTVLCTYFMPKLDMAGMAGMALHCRERFGFPVQMASVGRTAFVQQSEDKQIAYLYLKEEYLRKHYETCPDQPDVYAGVWETEKIQAAIRKTVGRLEGNPDAI